MVNIKDLNVSDTLCNAKKLLDEEENISPALRAMFELLLTIYLKSMNRTLHKVGLGLLEILC